MQWKINKLEIKTDMKTKLLIILIIPLFSFAQNQTWDYPVKPGSEEWAKLSSGLEMLKVCQIPESILQTLSTRQLAEICLNYPLFFEHTASNDEREAIKSMIQNFNGLSELISRKDGIKELIRLYREVSFSGIKAKDVPYKTVYLELLLANDGFINMADASDLVNLKEVLNTKYAYKLKYPRTYSLYNIRKSLLLGSVIYLKQKSINKRQSLSSESVIRDFVDNYDVTSPEELTTISKLIFK